MHRVSLCVAGMLLALPSLCADESWLDKKPRVHVLINPHVDFSRLQTYQWQEDQKKVAELEHDLRVVVAIQKWMSVLGYEIDIHEPDLRVQYEFEIGETKVPRATEPYVEPEYDPDDGPWGHLIGALIAALIPDDRTIEHVDLTVTLFDAETNWLAYRAQGTFPWSEDKSDWIVNQAVRELFEQLPRPGDTKQ